MTLDQWETAILQVVDKNPGLTMVQISARLGFFADNYIMALTRQGLMVATPGAKTQRRAGGLVAGEFMSFDLPPVHEPSLWELTEEGKAALQE